MTTGQLRRRLLCDPYTSKQYGDVCAMNRLSAKIRRKPRLYVVNTGPSWRSGAHWVAFYFTLRGPVEYFNPAGLAPQQYNRRFSNILLVNGPSYVYNTDILQSEMSTKCGAYCLFYGMWRCRGLSMEDILNKLTRDYEHNERIVLDFLNTTVCK